MSGGPSSSSQGSSIMQPWKPAQPAARHAANASNRFYLKGFGGRASNAEKGAFQGIRQNAQTAEGFMPQQQGLIGDLYAGGGFGEGRDAVTNAMGQAQDAYSPYLQSNYLDPMSNPYLQPAIQAAQSGAINSVGDRFSAAGRSFSGAHAGALGEGITNAALPMLLGQYNQNVGAQQNAAQGLMGSATGGAGALDTMQGNVMKARMAAPGQIQGLNIPENMILDSEAKRRAIRSTAINNAAANAAAIGGLGSMGTTSGSSQQFSDPFQTMLGGGLGLLGMLGSF